MSIDALRDLLPAYAKDISLNLSSLANETLLTDQQKWGSFLASAHAIGTPAVVRALGVLDEEEGVALRATFVVDPHNVVQHVYVTNLNVGRSPEDTLRVVDALQTDELCACNRPVGGETLAA